MPHYKYDNFNAEDFPDTGCNLAPRCLTCPLPRCKHDLPPKTDITRLRGAEIAVLSAQGPHGAANSGPIGHHSALGAASEGPDEGEVTCSSTW